jgi:hypothetical protein
MGSSLSAVPIMAISSDAPAPGPDENLRRYASLFEPCFKRRDQARWLAVYLDGLLRPIERKSIDAMARALGPGHAATGDLAQALQNFINQSPWDERLLWRVFRARLAMSPGFLVLHEVGFVKQGRQSVGVHRQAWGQPARKSNCQLILSLLLTTPEWAVPVGFRLYLPRAWVNDEPRLEASKVPEGERSHRSRPQVVLALLEEVREEIRPIRLVVEGRYGADAEFRHWLLARGCFFLIEIPADMLLLSAHAAAGEAALPAAVLAHGLSTERGSATSPSRYGLVHVRIPGFASSLPPAQLVVEETPGGARKLILVHVGEPVDVVRAAEIWNLRQRASQTLEGMQHQVGLSHFEGRSWLGFHHHLCLAALAQGMLVAGKAGFNMTPLSLHSQHYSI